MHFLHLRQQDPGDRKGDAQRLSSWESVNLLTSSLSKATREPVCLSSPSSCWHTDNSDTEIDVACNQTRFKPRLIFIICALVSCAGLQKHLVYTKMFVQFLFLCGQIGVRSEVNLLPFKRPQFFRWNADQSFIYIPLASYRSHTLQAYMSVLM